MRIQLRQLEVFAAIAETGSTVAAAARLSLSQSATSAALLELERALSTALFERQGRQLRLGVEGRALLPRARALLASAQEIERQFSAGQAPVSLRLAASTTIGNHVLPALLARFGESLDPEARHAFRASRLVIANSADVARAVARGDCDAGFIEGPCHEPMLETRVWMEDEMVIVAAADHPLARQSSVGVRDLRATRWLLREPGSGTREVVEHALQAHLGRIESEIELGSSDAIKLAVREGLGVACLSRWVVKESLERGELVRLRPRWPRITRRFHIVTPPAAAVSAALGRFIARCLDEAP